MASDPKPPTIEPLVVEPAFHLVGELILLHSVLDFKLNTVLTLMLGLEQSAMLLPTIAILDTARKIEIVKARNALIEDPGWAKPAKDFLEDIEFVSKFRNIAAHSTMIFHQGKAVLVSQQTAKMLKAYMKPETGGITSMAQVAEAIKRGNRAIDRSDGLIANWQAEYLRQRSAMDQPADKKLWPTMLPPDLRRILDGTLSGRHVQSADVWTDVREWLIKHQVEAPDGLPEDVPRGPSAPPQRE